MKNLRFTLTLLLALTFIFSLICPASTRQQQEELVIPADAHEKAIQALKALGPTRGAKKIGYRMVTILGIAKGIKAESEKIKAALIDLGAKETGTGYQIELSGDVLFDFDKWDIRQEAEEILEKIGKVIKASESPKVVISGHTDSKGSEDYNQKLSEKRAESVKKWLVDNAGINPNVMETIGYGESKPVASNTNPDGTDNLEGRKKNRRVEILIKKK